MQVFNVFRDNKVSVDVVATSEISVSLTLDPRCSSADPPSPVPPCCASLLIACCEQLSALLLVALALALSYLCFQQSARLILAKRGNEAWCEATILVQQDLGARPDWLSLLMCLCIQQCSCLILAKGRMICGLRP